LSRPAQVFVPEADFDRAHQIFYAEREDELWPRPFSARFHLQVILARRSARSFTIASLSIL